VEYKNAEIGGRNMHKELTYTDCNFVTHSEGICKIYRRDITLRTINFIYVEDFELLIIAIMGSSYYI